MFVSYVLFSLSPGIVTRRPLVLQLQKTEDGQQEYAEFGHLPRRRFSDFGMCEVNESDTEILQ